MNQSKIFALLPAAALAVCALAMPARAQEINTPIITIKSAQKPESTLVKARFEVLHMLPNAIQVRSLANGLEIHTFSYSDQIRDKMQLLFNQGGFQYGDKVTIWYQAGTEVALKIKGKPSKPL